MLLQSSDCLVGGEAEVVMYQNVSVNLLNVSKTIGNNVLFERLNGAVNSGQCLAITGANGAGKSTLLKMIAGLVYPTAGTIQVAGDGRQLGREKWISYMGLVSPEIIFYSDLTGMENLLFLMSVRGLMCSLSQGEECFEMVGLAVHKDQLVHTYSTGMRQRLKFAVLLAMQPLLWLLDEPSSNLDTEGKVLVTNMIVNGLARQKTIIIATNEPGEAQYANYQINLA